MRSSSYNIFSRKHCATSDVIVLNGIIGSMDLVSSEVAAEIEHFDPLSTRLPPAIQEYFFRRGYLTYRSEDEEKHILCTVAEAIHAKLCEIPHFLILPQLDCNFRCTYCYEKPLQKRLIKDCTAADHATTEHEVVQFSPVSKGVMDEATVAHAFQAISDILAILGNKITSPDLILYGGEPLDASIESTVRCIVHESERRGYVLGAVTNGYDIPVFLDLFGPARINNVQITVDGPQDVHDRRRIVRPYARTRSIARGGSGGSYDTIVQNVSLLLDREVDVTLRINTDASTLPAFDRLMSVIESSGWLQSPRFRAYASITYQKNEKGHIWSDYSNKELYERLRSYAQKHKRFYVLGHTINRGLMLKHAIATAATAPLRPTFCGANKGMYLFAPDGWIYPCWESVWSPEFAIGTFKTGSEYELRFNATKDHWFSRNAALIPECLNCRYVLFCGGGCAIYAYYNSGDITKGTKGSIYRPFCDTFQEWFPEVIMDMYEESQTDGEEPSIVGEDSLF